MKNVENVLPVSSNSETDPQDVSTNPNNDAVWFYGAKTDLIIGCGAWSVPLLLLTYYGTQSFPLTVITFFYALALLFNYPHYMATIYRAYRTKEDFAKYKIFTLHITLLIGLLIVLGHFSAFLLAIVFTIYLTWSPFHYTGQNFGIALMFARRCGVATNVKTRRAFYISFLTPYLMFFLAFHSSVASDDYVLSLGIPTSLAMYLWIAAAIAFLISTAYSFSAFIKQTGFSKMLAPLVMLSTQLVWFVIPTGLTFFTKAGVLQNAATIAVLAVMHSAQYLWITTYYARREKLDEQKSEDDIFPNRKGWNYLSYFLVLILGGIALFLPIPWVASWILHLDFGTSFLIVTALVNIHHFVLDGAIWKLRDGRIAALLLNKNGENTSITSSSLIKWFSGKSVSVRLIKATAVIGLLSLAGIDQAKFYFSGSGSNDSSLAIASQLNPFDATLKLKLARSSEKKGNLSAAQAELEEAIQINPALRKAQEMLARLLIQTGQYEKAFERYTEMFEHLSPDANTLINYGILAARFDKNKEAVKSFQTALELDKNQLNAHINLGELMEKQGNFNGAIKHYEQFLVLAASNLNASNEPPNPYLILRTALSLASAYRQIGEPKKAEASFNNALGLAETLSDNEVIAEVLIHRAELKIDEGNSKQALTDFRQSLTLQKSGGSYKGKPESWFKFGRFLIKINADSHLIYACFLKAEKQLENSEIKEETNKLSKTIRAEITQLESKLADKETKSIKSNLDKVLQEALRLEL